MSDTFVVEVHYGIKYTTKKPVPIPEIIESLESLEKLLKRTPAFVEQAYKTIKIVEVSVYVTRIESGSLIEDYIVKYVFRGKDNYDDAKKVFDNIMSDSKALHTVVAMGVGGLLAFGALQIIPTGAPTTHIEAYNNTLITIGADVEFSADDFHAALSTIKDKKTLAKEVIGAIRPARSDPSATIEVAGITAITLPQEAIIETPETYEPPLPQEREVTYKKVDLLIFASDRDKTSSGWAGAVPGVVPARTSMLLAAGVDPAKLHGKTFIKADIIAHESYVSSKKQYVVKKIEVTAIK